jgi:hypothetical protein
MKSLARPSFFRLFDLLVGASSLGHGHSRWTHDGVEFTRERHSFSGPHHSLSIEIFTLTRPGRRGWSILVTKEYWWVGAENKPFKNTRWARPIGGQRGDFLTWLRTQDAKIGHGSLKHNGADAGEEDDAVIEDGCEHE